MPTPVTFCPVTETRPSGGVVYHLSRKGLLMCSNVYMLAPRYAVRGYLGGGEQTHAPEYQASTKMPPSINCPTCREAAPHLRGLAAAPAPKVIRVPAKRGR